MRCWNINQSINLSLNFPFDCELVYDLNVYINMIIYSTVKYVINQQNVINFGGMGYGEQICLPYRHQILKESPG